LCHLSQLAPKPSLKPSGRHRCRLVSPTKRTRVCAAGANLRLRRRALSRNGMLITLVGDVKLILENQPG
jgi:hypothetical protein